MRKLRIVNLRGDLFAGAWLQRKRGLLIARYEMYKMTFTCAIALGAYLGSSVLLALWHTLRFRLQAWT